MCSVFNREGTSSRLESRKRRESCAGRDRGGWGNRHRMRMKPQTDDQAANPQSCRFQDLLPGKTPGRCKSYIWLLKVRSFCWDSPSTLEGHILFLLARESVATTRGISQITVLNTFTYKKISNCGTSSIYIGHLTNIV